MHIYEIISLNWWVTAKLSKYNLPGLLQYEFIQTQLPKYHCFARVLLPQSLVQNSFGTGIETKLL